MKKILAILVATLTVTAVMAKSPRVKRGDPVPEFTVRMVDGTDINISDLKGKVVLVNFWATWCPPCRAELAVVQKDLIDRIGSDDFVFLPISRGEELSKVTRFLKQNGYTFPAGIDPDLEIYPLFGATGIPCNYLVDKDGIVALVTVGFNHEIDDPFREIVRKVQKLLTN